MFLLILIFAPYSFLPASYNVFIKLLIRMIIYQFHIEIVHTLAKFNICFSMFLRAP